MRLTGEAPREMLIGRAAGRVGTNALSESCAANKGCKEASARQKLKRRGETERREDRSTMKLKVRVGGSKSPQS